MKRNAHVFWLIGGTTVGALAALGAACAEVQATLGTGRPTPEPTASVAPYDLQLVDALVAHSQEGVELSRIGDQRAMDEDVRNMALKAERDDAQELTRLQALRAMWFGARTTKSKRVVPGEDALTDEEMSQLGTLAGNDFDRMFVNRLIEHRRAGLAMADEVKRSTRRDELRDIAEELIEDHEGDLRILEQERAALDAAGG